MKKLLAIIALLFLPLIVSAQLTTIQGGTGTSSPSGILFGDGTLHLKTVTIGSGCSFSGGTLSCTGTGGSSFAFPFDIHTGYNSTTTVIGFNGLFSTASSTFSGPVFFPSLSQGILYTGTNGKVGTVATSSFALSQFTNDLASLTATNASLTFTGAYNGSVARTVGLNTANTNSWSVLQNFVYSSTTGYASFANSSSTFGTFGTVTIPNLGTPAGKFLAVDPNGKVIATSTPSGGTGTPASPTNSLQFNNAGSFGGADISYSLPLGTTPTLSAATVGHSLQLEGPNDGNYAGGNIITTSGSSGGQVGGEVDINAGSINSSSNGQGGNLNVGSGSASTGTGNGGDTNITSGNGGTTSGNGGFINLTGGASGLLGNGGSISLSAGVAQSGSNGDGGNVSIQAGAGDGSGSPGVASLGTDSNTNYFLAQDGYGAAVHSGGSGAALFNTSLLTGDRTYTFPDASGTLCLTTTCTGGSNSFAFPFTINTGYNSTSTAIGFTGANSAFFTGSTTFSGALHLPRITSSLLSSDSAGNVFGTATTTVTCSGSTSCTSFSIPGSSPITISSSGGGSGTGLGTTTADYIIATTTAGTATALKTYTNTIISTGGFDTVMRAVIADATSTLPYHPNIYIAPGRYFSTATSTFGGGNSANPDINDTPMWKIWGSGAGGTVIVVNKNTTGFNFSDFSKADVSGLTFYLQTGSTAIGARSVNTGIRSLWNSSLENLFITSTSTGDTGRGLDLQNTFRNTYNNIQFLALNGCILEQAEGSAFFIGDSVFENTMCDLSSVPGSVPAYELRAPAGGQVNQDTWIDTNGFSDTGTHTQFKLTNTDWTTARGINSEGFATTTDILSGTGNHFDYNYITVNSTGNYFGASATAFNNSFECTFVDNPSGSHRLLLDGNTITGQSNVVQGINGANCVMQGTGTFTFATTSASIVRDVYDNIGSLTYLSALKIQANKLYYDFSSTLNTFTQFISGALRFNVGGVDALDISSSGFSTTTVKGLNISAQATSTSNVGLNITTGCYAINGSCLSGGTGGSGTVTNIATTWPIQGGPITTTGTLTFGGLTTSSPITSGASVLYATGVNTIASVATSTPTVTSPIGYSGTLGSFVGGVSGAFTCATCLTTTSTFSPNSVITSNASGNLIATGTQLTVGNIIATTSATSYFLGNVGIGTTLPTQVNANSHLTVASTGSTDIVASTTDNTSSSDAIMQVYAPGSRVFMGAHGTNQITTQYGITVGGWGEIGAINSSFGTSNGLMIGTRTTATPIVFGTNSLERMRIDSNGNVGIGTTTPFYPLTITSTSMPQLSLSAGAGISQWTFRNAGGSLYISTTTVQGLSTTSISAFMMNGNGNVGIGTTTPTSKVTIIQTDPNVLTTALTIDGAGASAGAEMALNRGPNSGEEANIDFNTLGTEIWQLGMQNNNTNDFELWDGQDDPAFTIKNGTNAIGFGTTTPFGDFAINADYGDAPGLIFNVASSSATATTTLFAVSSSGNVGVGTTSPFGTFSINATAQSTPYFVIGSSTATAFSISPATSGNGTLTISTTTSGCAALSPTGLLYSTGSACGTGGGSSSVGPINTLQASNGSGGFIATGTPQLTIGNIIATTTAINRFGEFVAVNGAAGGSAAIEAKSLTAGGIQGARIENDTVSNIAFASFVSGDAQLRFSFLADGLMKWGPGSATTDIQLYRPAAGTLSVIGLNGSANSAILAVGTTSGLYPLSPASSTMAQLALGDAKPGDPLWLFRNAGGNLYMGTSTAQGLATSTVPAVTWLSNGFEGLGTSSPGSAFSIGTTGGINIGTGTSTFGSASNGINITNGCFAVNGVCVGAVTGGSGGSPGGSGTELQYRGGASTFSAVTGSAYDSNINALSLGTTTSALTSLTISSSTRAQLTLTSGDGTNPFIFRAIGGSLYISSSSPTTYATSTLPALSILSSGNVGIGTGVPARNLDIEGNTPFIRLGNTAPGGTTMELFAGTSGIGIGTPTTAQQVVITSGSPANALVVDTFNSGARLTVYNAGAGGLTISQDGTTGHATINNTNSVGGDLTFQNRTVTTMTLKVGGNVGIGTTTPKFLLDLAKTTAPQLSLEGNATDPAWTFRSIGGSLYISTSSPTTFATSSNVALGVNSAGQLLLGDYANCNGATNALGVTSGIVGCDSGVSDQRLKKDITPLPSGLDMIENLKPVSFYWKDLTNHNTSSPLEQYGFIAQDVQPLIPSAIGQSPDGYLTLDKTVIIPYLTKAIQEQQTEIEGLKVGVVNTAEENWQWFAIGMLILWNIKLTFRKKK